MTVVDGEMGKIEIYISPVIFFITSFNWIGISNDIDKHHSSYARISLYINISLPSPRVH